MLIGTNDKPVVRTIVVVLLLVLGFIALVLFNSCSTTKSKNVSKTHIENTSETKDVTGGSNEVDSTNVKKNNVVTVKESEEGYTKETVFEFFNPLGNIKDTVRTYPNISDDKIPVADYFPNRISKITIKETGTKKAKETKTEDNLEFTTLHKKETWYIIKTTTALTIIDTYTRNKNKKTTSYWGFLWLLLLIPAYLVYRNWPKIKNYLIFV